MEKKYEIIHDDSITVDDGVTLYRIKALRDFGTVTKGTIGGYIWKEDNLSHKGNCWVDDVAMVYGDARVSGNARLHDAVEVFDNAYVSGNAILYGTSRVFCNARVFDNAQIYNDTMIFDNAQVFDNSKIFGESRISGNAVVSKDTTVRDSIIHKSLEKEIVSVNNVIEYKGEKIMKTKIDFKLVKAFTDSLIYPIMVGSALFSAIYAMRRHCIDDKENKELLDYIFTLLATISIGSLVSKYCEYRAEIEEELSPKE